MGFRYNDGIVYTEENCIDCTRCVNVCPVMGANIIVKRDEGSIVEVNSKNCVDCGKCIDVCKVRARDYRDDTEEFLNALSKGKKVSVIVDPAFLLSYADVAKNVIGYLQNYGVDKVYDGAYGTDISAWMHATYLRENANEMGLCDKFISSNCAAICNFGESKSPLLLDRIIPVYDPVLSMAVYARKYLHDENIIAYIGACTAEGRQIANTNFKSDNNALMRLIDYNVTVEKLLKAVYPKANNEYDVNYTVKSQGFGQIAAMKGGFARYMQLLFPGDRLILSYSDVDSELLHTLEQMDEGESHPLMVEITSCKGGCIEGPAIRKKDMIFDDVYRRIMDVFAANDSAKENYSNHEALYASLCEEFKDLNKADFIRSFKDDYRQPFIVPDKVINNIFKELHMEKNRHIDCNSCGYGSCKSFAVACANGYARMEACVRYMNEEIKYKFRIDRLTGVYNSGAFFEEAKAILESDPYKRYVIISADINSFRVVNELYGLDVGDKVLKYLAEYLSDFVEGRGLCCRAGGGLFGMLLEYNKENMEALYSIESIDCAEVGVDFPITLRCGIYVLKEDYSRLPSVFSLANYAADKSKDKSVCTYIQYTDDFRRELRQEAQVTSNMKKAMEDNEFTVYFQPQYDHSTGKMIGAEALARWINKEGNFISPGIFVPIFEKNGFISTLDMFIWDKAFAMVGDWNKNLKNSVPISLNISRQTMKEENIIEYIRELGKKYKVKPEQIQFEITESAYMDNQELIISRVEEIKDMGYMVSMDDFGSGFSSLNTLKNVPFDIIKLDMGFVRGERNADKGGSIIRSMVDMAHSLNLKVISEGVETKEQADMLMRIGCPNVQGYLYAKPMPMNEFENLLAENKEVIANDVQVQRNIDLNNFFLYGSGESMMFDRYTEAAGIFELEFERLNIIRFNDAMLKLLASLDITFDNFAETLEKGVSSLERAKIREAADEAITSRGKSSTVVKLKMADGGTVYMKVNLWPMGVNGNKNIIYVVFSNVTDVVNMSK